MNNHTIQLTLQNLDAVKQLASSIADQAARGEAIILIGDLGVGKTTFSRFFIQHLTSASSEYCNRYKSKCHIDIFGAS